MTSSHGPVDSSDGRDLVIETRELTKRFPGVVAADRVSFSVRQGEIHCLLGENGAGKTTLAECLYGFYKPDSGEILYRGRRVALASPRDAIRLGIGMVHQHFVLIRPFTVIENVLLRAQTPGITLDMRRVEKDLESLCRVYGTSLDLRAQIWQLSVGEQQWVEILNAIHGGARLLILDEPTSVLTPQETEGLFQVLRRMRQSGLSIVFITHKLREVLELSDRVTVLRRGRVVDTVSTSAVTKEDLARMMVGRDVVFQVQPGEAAPGRPVLEVRDLRAFDDRGHQALQGVSLSLRQNEILGVAGVSGNGQRELFETLIGIRKPSEGEVLLNGEDVTRASPRRIRQRGLAHIPADRMAQGLVLDFSVAQNLILGRQRERMYRRGPFLDQKRIEGFAKEMITAFEILTPSSRQRTRFLSGGNLQKVILARELSRKIDCLVASQPTRGLDIGVMEYVHRRLLEKRDEGVGILLISEDLEEVLALSNRVAVMFKGKIAGLFESKDIQPQEIGLLMAGMGEKVT